MSPPIRNKNIRNKHGDTALRSAIKHSNVDAVNFLVLVTDLRIKNNAGKSPFQIVS